MDGLTIVTRTGCSECKLLKKIFEKYRIEYGEVEHASWIEDEYPIIYLDGQELSYLEFMKIWRKELI